MNSERVSISGSTPSAPAVPIDSAQMQRRAPIHLTPREAEIVRYVMLGESNKQIARRLGISNYTVRDHVSNLLKKSGVTSRSRLALVLPAPAAPTVSTPDPAKSTHPIGGNSHALHDAGLDHMQAGLRWRK